MFKPINFLILVLGFFLGYKIEKHDIYQRLLVNFSSTNSALKVNEWKDSKLTVSNYSYGVPMYLNEPYSDTIGDKRLEGLRIIKIMRHQKGDIKLKTKYPITIYRVTSDEDQGLYHDYEDTNIQVKLIGNSSVHNKVVKKDFKAGLIVLAPGGPVSTSPVLFKYKGNFKDLSIDIYSDLSEQN